jgi:hypothetical protein
MYSTSEKEHVIVEFWFLNSAKRDNWETKARMGE